MHHCLRVDEILRLIASELVESGWRHTALTLACCCKSLEDPVLDVLWGARGEGLVPLLRIFPEDVWNSNVCVPTASVIRPPFTQPVNPHSTSSGSRRTWSGLGSNDILERYERFTNTSMAPHLCQPSWCCSLVPSTNHYFQIYNPSRC